ncbi:uncharacterized protein LOC141835796 [Curcuma longa]|uniref:uncharacterized protein LOC141835796 n=1 Tax=Curcuma longa TaxID=136217 RepID=UPI003D9F9091
MKEVVLHVYNVTNSESETTNNAILKINRICKDRFGIGGVFHSAIEVYEDEEWSFGYCEEGSGVFNCLPSGNSMYTYRERIVLGETKCSISDVNLILIELSEEWPGRSYNLLSKNCNHFCDTFCERLGVSKLPGWVNRFANVGDAAVVAAGNATLRLRKAKEGILTASRVAYKFMSGLASNPNSEGTSESPSNSDRGKGPWHKNLMSMGAKPPSSSTSELLEESDVVPIHPQPPSSSTSELLEESDVVPIHPQQDSEGEAEPETK